MGATSVTGVSKKEENMKTDMKLFGLVGLVLAVAVFFGQLGALWIVTGKSNTVNKFNLEPSRIAKDLDGRIVNVLLNQVWPFDASQSIDVKVVGKKQLDEYVLVVADVKALAPVQQEAIKEQSNKDLPKKLPTKLSLSGRMKLTYEVIDNEWYLLNAESLTLKATPVD